MIPRNRAGRFRIIGRGGVFAATVSRFQLVMLFIGVLLITHLPPLTTFLPGLIK